MNKGDYVRTEKGEITKIEKLTLPEEPSDCLFIKFENEPYSFKYKSWETIDFKSSHNLIDLIEPGDYVNGFKVYYCYCADEDSTGLFIDTEKGRQWLDKPSQIKSILTREQFSAMEYRLGDK